MDCRVSKIPLLLPTDEDAVYVITGASRGIGLEHARQFLEKTKAHVVCTVRKSSTIAHLQAFQEQGHSHRISIVELDTSDEDSIQVRRMEEQYCIAVRLDASKSELDFALQAAVDNVDKAHPQGIDILLNNAGTQEKVCRAVET